MLVRKDFKKGEKVDFISVAGKDFYQLIGYGIIADIFEEDDGFHIPLINSDGKGNFIKFITELKEILRDKPIIFECVINEKLQNVLKRYGFYICK